MLSDLQQSCSVPYVGQSPSTGPQGIIGGVPVGPVVSVSVVCGGGITVVEAGGVVPLLSGGFTSVDEKCGKQ